MADGQRPGGLTALAMFNFVFAGLSLLFALGKYVSLTSRDALDKLSRVVVDATLFKVSSVFNVAVTILLIVAGIGYLKQRRIGRNAATAYGVIGVIGSIVEMMALSVTSFFVLVQLLYCLATLYLANVTFKEDLVDL